ncbi:tau 95 subunit of transcription factor TFIIIC [Coemansia sp. RSA 1933]|nr:tau 95 subunit of transcription factor TFIIIC [Coemansia sp. RSA 1933]
MRNDEINENTAVRRNLPQHTVVSVEYPGYVNNAETAIKTLGGQEVLARILDEDVGMPVELRYRYDDLTSHPINGDVVPTQNLLIKVKRRARVPRRRDSQTATETSSSTSHTSTTAEVVGIISKTVRFRKLADFQVVPPPSDPMWVFSKVIPSLDLEGIKELGQGTLFNSDTDTKNAYIPAPFLDRRAWPAQVPLSSHSSDTPGASNAESSTATKSRKTEAANTAQRTFNVVEIKYSSPTVPTEPNPDALRDIKDTPKELLDKLKEILEKQPVISRNAMSVFASNSEIPINRLNNAMATVSYLMDSGPWRSCWIRFGYDPRKHEDAYRYQMIDMRGMNSKEQGNVKRGVMRGVSKNQQEPRQPHNPVEAQKYIFDMDSARQGMAGKFQLMHLDIPVLNELVEYPGGRRRRPCERSGWLYESLISLIRNKALELRKNISGSDQPTQELRINYAELDKAIAADRRGEDLEIAGENMVREREAARVSRNGNASQPTNSRFNEHIDHLMSQLASIGNAVVEAGSEIPEDAADDDDDGDFDDYGIFGEEDDGL